MTAGFGDLFRPEAIVERLAVAGKKPLFLQLGTLAAVAYGVDARQVSDALAAREKLGATGFGGGVALPHARLPGLIGIVGIVARLAQPIDYAALDGLPVDLVVALLSPVEAGAEHLKALALVSRRMRDGAFTAKLRGAGSRDALYALVLGDEARDAA